MGEAHQHLNAQRLEYPVVKVNGIGGWREVIEEAKPVFFV